MPCHFKPLSRIPLRLKLLDRDNPTKGPTPLPTIVGQISTTWELAARNEYEHLPL